MAQQFEYDDDDVDEFPEDGNAIRQVRKALREAEKREKALTQELDALRGQARLSTVRQALTERGLNPKIAAFVPENLTDPDAVADWLEEYGDVFGAPAKQEANADATGEQAPPPGAQRFNETTSGGRPPTGDESQLLALIKGAANPQELSQILHGNPNGPSF